MWRLLILMPLMGCSVNHSITLQLQCVTCSATVHYEAISPRSPDVSQFGTR